MKRLELHTDDESLREILSSGKKYYIPKFQHDYSWEHEQWEALWDDILALSEGKEKYHYMGYLVIQPATDGYEDAGHTEIDRKNASKIIDGQQRLTTFSCIVLAAVKRLKEMEGQEDRQENLLNNFIGSEDLVYLRRENKLILNRNNQYYYKKAAEGNDIPKRGQKKTVQLMHEAIEYFFQQFKKYHSGEDIGKLIATMSEQLLFTTIYIGNELNAYKVFETLNARGVQLSSGDLLKNYIFSLIDRNNDTPDNILDEWDEQWEMIGQNIGDQYYTNYIHSEWNSRNKLVRKPELFKSIKQRITDHNLAKSYLDDLERKSNCYAALLNPEHEFWKDHPDLTKIKKDLAVLKLFNIKQPISLLLVAYDKTEEKFSQILRWITVFTIRYNVIGRGHTGEQETFYNRISLMLNDGASTEEIKNKLLESYPNDEKFKNAFRDKTMPTEQSHKKARYLMARIEGHLSKKEIDDAEYTIEHILPLKPNDEWLDYFGNNWNLFSQRLGNMALVTPKENNDLAQKSFDEKKALLLNTRLEINKKIDYAQWNTETIEARQTRLAEIASQVWRID